MSKSVYIKCPRCDLNFIQKKDKLCPVCKQEMQALSTNYTEDASANLGLCPICKVNYIMDEETVCTTCVDESDLSAEEIDALYGGISVEKETDPEDDEDDDDDEDDMEIINLDMEDEETDDLDMEDEVDPLDDFDESLE